MVVARIRVRVRPLIPRQAGGHRKQVLQTDRVLLPVRKDVGIGGQESGYLFDRPPSGPHTSCDRRPPDATRPLEVNFDPEPRGPFVLDWDSMIPAEWPGL